MVGIVALLTAIVGGVMFASGRRTFRKVQPLPRTVSTVKENFK